MDSKELKAFVENNPKLVVRKQSKRYPSLFVLKYTRKVFYDNLWSVNPLLLECRGLVVDENYNVVVKPFTKVFNHGENGTTFDPEAKCTVVRKVNGFMACATRDRRYSNNLIISTTGSLDSEHVDIAARHIPAGWYDYFQEGETMIFEICDPDDPHIVHEHPGAYLIGGGANIGSHFIPWSESTLNYMADEFGMYRPECCHGMMFKDVVELAAKVDHEGYMVYSDGKGLKIKSPYYLTTKFLARMGDAKLANILHNGNIREAMRNFDEEFYPLIKHVKSLGTEFFGIGEQEKIKIIKGFLSRKE
jgi:hypothetical protein